MARSLLLTDQTLMDRLADLAPAIAANLIAGAAEGRPGCESAADAWTRLALHLGALDDYLDDRTGH